MASYSQTMEMKEMIFKSPLGSQSQFYEVKTKQNGGIQDTPTKGTLEVYPAGYTKFSEKDDEHRQDLYQKLWEESVTSHSEEKLFPFGKKDHWIELVPNPENKFDPNAIHVVFRATPESPLAQLNGRDMGFIPMKISKMLKKNIKLINGGKILKVRSNFHKKYYTAKIVLGYGDTTFSSLDKTTMARFTAILNE